ASATIANPGELARSLTGSETTVIGDDGAPRAERTVALWNPPLTDEELGLRASPLGEASRLMADLVTRGLRTLCFAKSRRAAELIHRFTADRLGDDSRLSPYRAGYTPAQRREIERRLLEGELLGVSATNALELGIDVGLLDCVLSVGFPGTVASLRQQWGRAGRRGHGLAVLVASEDALDQYFMREPEALLERRVEAAILDHENPRVLDGHVLAAAFEALRGGRRLGVDLSFGRVVVTEQVVGYQKKSITTQENIELVPLELPQTEFDTEAIWFVPEPWMLVALEREPRLLGSLHGPQHALIALLPLWAMCVRWDIGGLSTNLHFPTGAPTIFVYDGLA